MSEIKYESEIAKEIRKLHGLGLALIPADEKTKKPKIKWKDGFTPLSLLHLFDSLGKFETNAVAVICGQESAGDVSDGLFVIDFDVKNKKEFGECRFLSLFRDVFSRLEGSLRFEESQSGGNHIIYRIYGVEGEFPAGLKAASRVSTEQELLINPSEKTKCFIETRGTGNLCQIYPSPGYKLIEGEIGLVSWDDHLDILRFLYSFNEVAKEPKVKDDIKRDIKGYYIEGENPFEAYNRLHTGGLLEDAGWVKSRTKGVYDQFCRPGSNNINWIGATYDQTKRFYNVFTTSSDLETRAYSPADLLCETKFSGSRVDAYPWLVAQGYGKLKKSVETRLVKNSAKYGSELPANISKESRAELDGEKLKVKEKYPHGVFWNIDENEEFEISQRKLDSVIINLGFRNIISEGLVYIDGWKVKKVDEARIFHHLINYILRVDGFQEVDEIEKLIEDIDEEDRNDVEKIYNEHSSFINKFGKITIDHLKEFGKIQDGKLLISCKNESFKFYKNCYISITEEGICEMKYDDLGDRLVLEHLIINRDFKFVDDKKSVPYHFFDKAIGLDDSLFTIIGYLTHDFVDNSMDKIFAGLGTPGAGKNIFFNLLNNITSVHVIDGRQVELDNNLLQSYNFQRILVISDVEEKFKFDFFKNFSSGAASLKKLYKDVVVLKRRQMPKPVVLTNFSYKMVEGLERRMIDIEFTDFFSKIKGGVKTYFKMMFPGFDKEDTGDWSENDWNSFDSIVANGIHLFLKYGEIKEKQVSERGWTKHFQADYTHLYDYISERIEDWCSLYKVKLSKFEEDYIAWTRMHNIRGAYSMTKVNKSLVEYCEHYGYEFVNNIGLRDENTFVAKFKTFKKIGYESVSDIEQEKEPF